MYSYKERMYAVQCLIQNRFNYTKTIMELGYPTSTQALRNWYNEYKVNGELHHKDDTQRKYSKEERLLVRNSILLVTLMYDMCKVQLVQKAESENNVETVNEKDVKRAVEAVKSALPKIKPVPQTLAV